MNLDNISYNFISNYQVGYKDGDKEKGILAYVYKVYLQNHS